MRLIDGRNGYRDGYESGAGFSWLSALPVFAALALVGSVFWISRGFDETASWTHFMASLLIIGVLIVFVVGLGITFARWTIRVLQRIGRALRG